MAANLIVLLFILIITVHNVTKKYLQILNIFNFLDSSFGC